VGADDHEYLAPEARARVEIDRKLIEAGWQVQDRARANLYAGQGMALREFVYQKGHGRRDYALAACFRLLPDGAFRGDFAGNGKVPWPRTQAELPRKSWDMAGIRDNGPECRLACSAERPAHRRTGISQLSVRTQGRERYREAVPEFLSPPGKVSSQARATESLARALDLATRMNQGDLRELVKQDILGLAGDLLDEDPAPYGLIRWLLDASQSRRLETTAVRDLSERAPAAAPGGHALACQVPAAAAVDLHRPGRSEGHRLADRHGNDDACRGHAANAAADDPVRRRRPGARLRPDPPLRGGEPQDSGNAAVRTARGQLA
jgi:hypothetical protein